MPHVIRPPKKDRRLPKIEQKIRILYLQFKAIRMERELHYPVSEELYNLELDNTHSEILKLRQLRLDYEPPK